LTCSGQAARPRDLGEIATLVSRFAGQITFVAGGTDLIIAQGHAGWPDLIIDISRTRGLDFIHVTRDAIHIGAAVTMASLARHPGILENMPMMAQAAGQVGSVQIRNRATVGGNIASALPAGDLLPVLKSAEARIGILRRDGRRQTLGFDETVVGRGKTSLLCGDLITSVSLPLTRGKNRVSAFVKVGRREALTIARLNLAATADFDRIGNRVSDICIVAGALAPVPLRLRPVEAVVRGREIEQALADDFLYALRMAVDDAIPERRSRPYKRHAVTGLGLDLLYKLFGCEFAPPALRAAVA